MNLFERRFRKFSVTNLTMYIIVGKIFCFLLLYLNPTLYEKLIFDGAAIMAGEIWRLITYMFIPQSNPIFFIFEIMFFYWMGTALEKEWGSFGYTMYILASIVGVALGVLIGYFLGWEGMIATNSIPAMFEYTMFLPFAWYNGNEQLRIYFVLPIKIKYLAVIDVILILSLFVTSTPPIWCVLLLSMLNMVIFFIVTFVKRGKQRTRLANFHHKVAKVEREKKKTTIHHCTVCGITEKDDPNMTFRYCSKCYGDHEYCEKHLADHTHITNVVEFPKK